MGRVGAMVLLDDGKAEDFLGLARMGLRRIDQRSNAVFGQWGAKVKPLVHQVVGDGHGFAELIFGRLGDPNVIAEGLRHFFDAVGALEDRHDDDDLRRLAFLFLQIAADEVVEGLVGAAEFDIGLDHHRVPALHEWVEKLVDVDGLAGLVAFLEGVAFEHAGDGHLGGEFEGVDEGHLVEPFGVVVNLDFVRRQVENFAGLIEVGFGVGLDLLGGEDGAGFLFAGGIADGGGGVADDEDRLVAEVLELPHFAKDDGVAEVEVRGGGVHAELDAELAAGFFGVDEPLLEFLGGVDVVGATEEEFQLLVDAKGRGK